MSERTYFWHKLGRHLRGNLTAGLFIVVPLAATVLILKIVFDLLDRPLQRALRSLADQSVPSLGFLDNIVDQNIPGLGVIFLIIIIYLSGLMGTHFIGRRLVTLGGQLIDRIPLIGSLYRTAEQATQLFIRASGEDKNRNVVLLDFPRAGIKSIGLVTAPLVGSKGEPLAAVYVPTTPNPTSGYLVIVPEEQLVRTDITVDEAMRIIISGGILSSDALTRYTDPVPVPVDKETSNH